jgi:hypothetical protein
LDERFEQESPKKPPTKLLDEKIRRQKNDNNVKKEQKTFV